MRLYATAYFCIEQESIGQFKGVNQALLGFPALKNLNLSSKTYRNNCQIKPRDRGTMSAPNPTWSATFVRNVKQPVGVGRSRKLFRSSARKPYVLPFVR